MTKNTLKFILKWHGIYWLLVFILSLILAFTLKQNSLIYGALIGYLAVLAKVLNYFSLKRINHLVDLQVKRKRILLTSMLLFVFQMIVFFIPFLIALIVNICLNEWIFNVYMLIAIYLTSYLVLTLLSYLGQKRNEKGNING